MGLHDARATGAHRSDEFWSWRVPLAALRRHAAYLKCADDTSLIALQRLAEDSDASISHLAAQVLDHAHAAF